MGLFASWQNWFMSLFSFKDVKPEASSSLKLPVSYSVLPSKVWRLTGEDDKVFDVLPEERVEWIDNSKAGSLTRSLMDLKKCGFEDAMWEIYDKHLNDILLDVPCKKAVFRITQNMTVLGARNIHTGRLFPFSCVRTIIDGDEISVHVGDMPKDFLAILSF
jgi:hypothetical protein